MNKSGITFVNLENKIIDNRNRKIIKYYSQTRVATEEEEEQGWMKPGKLYGTVEMKVLFPDDSGGMQSQEDQCSNHRVSYW